MLAHMVALLTQKYQLFLEHGVIEPKTRPLDTTHHALTPTYIGLIRGGIVYLSFLSEQSACDVT